MTAPGHRGNNFHEMVEVGQSVAPQTVTGVGSVDGNAIEEPWRKAAQIAFLINIGAISTSAVGAVSFEGLRRDDGTTWDKLNQVDGSTDLDGDVNGKLVDGGDGENATLLATLYTQRVDSDTYGSVRISIDVAGASETILVGVVHVLFGLIRRPSTQTDEIFSQQYN